MTIAGEIIIAAGVIFILFGVAGLLRFKNFYARILVTAKIDTVGMITVFIGMAVKHGLSFFSLKVLLLMVVLLIVNPLASHMIARAAWSSGYKTDAQTRKIKDGNKDYL